MQSSRDMKQQSSQHVVTVSSNSSNIIAALGGSVVTGRTSIKRTMVDGGGGDAPTKILVKEVGTTNTATKTIMIPAAGTSMGSPTKLMTVSPSRLGQAGKTSSLQLTRSPQTQRIVASCVKSGQSLPSQSNVIAVSGSSTSPAKIIIKQAPSSGASLISPHLAKSVSTNTAATQSIVKQRISSNSVPMIGQQFVNNSSTQLFQRQVIRPTNQSGQPAQQLLKHGSSGTSIVAQPLNQATQNLLPNSLQGFNAGQKLVYVRSVIPNQARPGQMISSTPRTVTSVQTTPSSHPVRLQLSQQNNMTKTTSSGTQRLLLPATQSVGQLSSGTPIIMATDQSVPRLQGYAVISVPCMSQVQNSHTSLVDNSVQKPQQQQQPQQIQSNHQPVQSSSVTVVSTSAAPPSAPRSQSSITSVTDLRQKRKPCNCTKSQCLKLYCDCFANGEFCSNCNCTNCANNLNHEDERSRAIKSCLERNPHAFHPKIGKGRNGIGDRRHNKGCNCKRSGCLKNYCECYEARILCSSQCKCSGCRNNEETSSFKSIYGIPDSAEAKSSSMAKTKADNSVLGKEFAELNELKNDGQSWLKPMTVTQRPAFTLVTQEVADAMCACMLAQAEEAEKIELSDEQQESMVLQEFGRCLRQVIMSASKFTSDVS